MANPFFFPGGDNTYVPAYQGDLLIEYSRSPDSFVVNKIAGKRNVDKRRGYYLKMENQAQSRVPTLQSVVWAPGNDRPNYGQADRGQWVPYSTVRHNETVMLDLIGIQQGGWDITSQVQRKNAEKLMTVRTVNLYNTLQTSGNWPSTNTATATALAGGQWTAATSALPYIKETIYGALKKIQLATFGMVQQDQLQLVLGPSLAEVAATSAEFIDFLKQQSNSEAIWQGKGDYMNTYGLGKYLFGLDVVIDVTAEVTSQVGATTLASNFVINNDTCLILSKPNAIGGFGTSAYSTVELFMYEEMSVEEREDTWNRRIEASVTDDYAVVLAAPETGFYVTGCQ